MSDSSNIAIILLAAGASERMGGRDKLLVPLGDEPLLRRATISALRSRAFQVVVVLSEKHPERAEALNGLNVTLCYNHKAASGMASSIVSGLDCVASTASGVMISLADMPNLQASDYDLLIEAFDPDEAQRVVRAADPTGRPGNPVVFGKPHFDALRGLTGDTGARDLLKFGGLEVRQVELPKPDALLDIDTEEDLENWLGNLDSNQDRRSQSPLFYR